MKHADIKRLLKLLRENGVQSARFREDGSLAFVKLGDPPPPPPPRGVHAKRIEDDEAREAAEDGEAEDPRYLLERIQAANRRPREGA